MAEAAAGVNEIFSRLFDHRPFLKGEIQYIKQDFEEKRNDREVDNLFRSLELITEIKEVQIEQIVNATDQHIPRTIADLQVALHMLQDTLHTQDKFRNREENLKIKKQLREQKLSAAQADVKEKLKLIEESQAEKEKQLKEKFKLMEKNNF